MSQLGGPFASVAGIPVPAGGVATVSCESAMIRKLCATAAVCAPFPPLSAAVFVFSRLPPVRLAQPQASPLRGVCVQWCVQWCGVCLCVSLFLSQCEAV